MYNTKKAKNLPKPLDKPYILRYNDGVKNVKNITILDYITKPVQNGLNARKT